MVNPRTSLPSETITYSSGGNNQTGLVKIEMVKPASPHARDGKRLR